LTAAGQKYVDWLCVIAANFMWATQVAAIKLIGDRLGAATIAFVPMIFSTLLFLPAISFQKNRRPVPWRWAEAKHFLAAGLGGAFLLQLTYTLGAQRTLAANAGIITLTIPVVTAITGSVMLGEKLNGVRILGFAVAIAGVCLTSVPDLRSASFGESRYLAGNLLFFTACALSAFYNTYCKLLIDRGYGEIEILVYTSLAASIGSLPLFFWWETDVFSRIVRGGTPVIAGLAELSLVVYGAAMVVFFHVLKRLDITQAILGTYLLPFFIALIGLTFFHESITMVMAIGGTMILVSTLAITMFEGEILKWWERKTSAPSTSSSR
jgi:drug/metabolite transporter (DMT)-like permease